MGSNFTRKGPRPSGGKCAQGYYPRFPGRAACLVQAPTASPVLCPAIRRPPKLRRTGIPQQRALCSRLAVARRAPIKSLPARSCEQAPTCAPRTRKPSRNTQGLASLGNLRAQPGPAFFSLWLTRVARRSLQGGIFSHSDFYHSLLPSFVILGSNDFSTSTFRKKGEESRFNLVYLSSRGSSAL